MAKRELIWGHARSHIANAEKKLNAVKHDMNHLSYDWAHCCRSDLRGAISELQNAIEVMAQVEALGWKD